MYRFNAIPIKIPMAFSTGIKQKKIKIFMETQKIPNSQNNLNKEEQSWKNHASWLPHIHTHNGYYSAIKNNKMFPFSAKWSNKFLFGGI